MDDELEFVEDDEDDDELELENDGSDELGSGDSGGLGKANSIDVSSSVFILLLIQLWKLW